MSLKISGFLDALGGTNQIVNSSVSTPPIVQTKLQDVPERYTGGSIDIKVLRTDTQAQLAWRGLYKHAQAAGLDTARAKEFADAWVTKTTTFNHHANGQSVPFTDKEFEALKTKGTTSFELTKEFDAEILADLNRRVDAITVEDDSVVTVESNIKLTPHERAAYQEKLAQEAQTKAALQEKAVSLLTDGKTRDGKPLDETTALTRYIERNYNSSGRVWGDKINEMANLAKTQGVKVDMQFNEDGTALVNINAADKQKLDSLFNQALGETITGEQASIKGQQEATNQVVDTGKMYVNGAINTVNHITEPVRGVLEVAGVDTSAAKLPKLEYKSEIGKKYGTAGELGTELGIVGLSAPAALKTTVGKVVSGVSGVYNVSTGAAGVDPTEKDANGNPRQMGTLERGLRIVGGAAEVFGARPTFSEAGTTASKTAGQTEEMIEAVTSEGVVIRTKVPTSTASEAATAKPIQTAEDLMQEMVMTPEQAAKVEQLKQQRFIKEAERKLDEGVAQAKGKGKLNEMKADEPDDYSWLTADKTGRRERLAFDPDTKDFKVQEAKVALQAEADGVVKNPVRRAIDERGSSQGGDYIGADGKYWDVKDAKGGANKIADTANPGDSAAENVLVDCMGMSQAEIQALKAQVDVKLQTGAGEVHYIVPKP